MWRAMRQADSESSDNSLEISSKKLNPGHLISSLSCCFLRKTAQDFLDSYRFWSCDVNQVERWSGWGSISKCYSSSSHTQLLYIHSWLFSEEMEQPRSLCYSTVSCTKTMTSRTKKHIQSCNILPLVRGFKPEILWNTFLEFSLNIDMPHSKSSGFLVKHNTEMEYCLFIEIRNVFGKLHNCKKWKIHILSQLEGLNEPCTKELRKLLLSVTSKVLWRLFKRCLAKMT